jgi:hypothetical protein
VRLAFGKAFDLGRVQGIELAGVVPLLGEQPIDQGADSDEAAQAFRDDGAWYSDMMSPRARSLAGW